MRPKFTLSNIFLAKKPSKIPQTNHVDFQCWLQGRAWPVPSKATWRTTHWDQVQHICDQLTAKPSIALVNVMAHKNAYGGGWFTLSYTAYYTWYQCFCGKKKISSSNKLTNLQHLKKNPAKNPSKSLNTLSRVEEFRIK